MAVDLALRGGDASSTASFSPAGAPPIASSAFFVHSLRSFSLSLFCFACSVSACSSVDLA